MRKVAHLSFVVLLASWSTTLIGRSQSSAATDSPRVIEMTANKFEFVPNEVHVKIGERVQIKLRTADRAHGLNLNIYPEGSNENGNPGLVFDHPQDDAKVEKNKDRVIEFLAAGPGTYDFKCSVKCSMGHDHDKMAGKLIVDEPAASEPDAGKN